MSKKLKLIHCQVIRELHFLNFKKNDGGETVLLEEEEITSKKVIVTAEDGSTVTNYFIHATRPSPSA
mgnify:CR=1 FL=1